MLAKFSHHLACRWCQLTFVIGLGLTALALLALKSSNDNITEEYFDELSQERHQELLSLHQSSLRLFNTLDAFINSRDAKEMSQKEHLHDLIRSVDTFVKTLNLTDAYPSVFSVGLTLKVKHEDLSNILSWLYNYYPHFQYQALPGFNPSENSYHYLVIYSFPSSDTSVIGFDSASDPLTRPAIEQAFQKNTITVTDPLILIEDEGRDHVSFINYKSLNTLTPALQIVGYVSTHLQYFMESLERESAKFHAPKFVGSIIEDEQGQCFLHVISGIGRQPCDTRPDTDLFWTVPWENFRIHYYPTPQMLSAVYTLPLLPVFLVGVLVSALMAFIVRILTRRSQDLAVMVNDRTLELTVQRQRAEESVLATQRFIANISHELRTPLNAIMGINQILQGDIQHSGQQRLLDVSHENAKHLLSMIEEVLDLSRLQNDSFDFVLDTFDLQKAILPAVSFLESRCKQKHLSAIVSIANDIPRRVMSDKKRLLQILFNLIGNAVKFTAKGHIQLTIEANYVSEEQCGINILVEDTGIGIPAEKLSEIFNPFKQVDNSATRAHSGAGLGLAITQQLVTRMEGEISVTSSPGKGSVFAVSLPLLVVKAEHALPIEQRVDFPRSLAGMQVVILDDVLTNTQVQGILLEQLGISVTTFNQPHEAIDFCVQHAEQVDALLCDIQMPVLNGLDVARMLRASGFTKAIVGLSGNAYEEDVQHALAAGMDDYLTKPIQLDKVISVLQKYYTQQHAYVASA